MKKGFLILALVSYTCWLCAQTGPLFKIVENGLTGYINVKGEVVIKPIFFNGQDFAEGVAAVRQNGHYGFIDESGTFILEPRYEMATDFYKGLAGVYTNGRITIINKKGAAVLPSQYKSLRLIDERRAIVVTYNNHEGVIDLLEKRLLIDTVFSSISNFTQGVAVVEEPLGRKTKRYNGRVGLIDSLGHFIIPFGRFEHIGHFVSGVAIVRSYSEKRKSDCFSGAIDPKGNLLFKRPIDDISYLDGNFYEGVAKFSMGKKQGFVDLKGQLVGDKIFSFVNYFSNGKALVTDTDGNYIFIDRNLKSVGPAFNKVLNAGFRDGYALVESDEGYGLIDTLGNWVVAPVYEDVDPVGLVNGYFFFIETEGNKEFYGISDVNGRIVSKAVMDDFDKAGFINGLLRCTVNGKATYLDKNGQMVWQASDEKQGALRRLNIDFMNRGYFRAQSFPRVKTDHEMGGWAPSSNMPQQIPQGLAALHQLTVTIDTHQTQIFRDRYQGFHLYVRNGSGDSISFKAQDSRLYMKLQARDRNGEWRDLEHLPNSWCGNSYHTLHLAPNTYWTFTMPDYEGEMNTFIRAELKYVDPSHPKKEKLIYSNEIRGSVNPAQFWNKLTYYPNGLMDPYNE